MKLKKGKEICYKKEAKSNKNNTGGVRWVKWLTLGILVVMATPLEVSAVTDTKTSEVSVTFVEPENAEERAKLEKKRQELEDEQVQEIHMKIVDAPGESSRHTTYVYKDKVRTVITNR